MTAEMTIGSLFAGIGGLELGLERAGVGHTVWQVEQSEYCRAVLAKHWPDATRYEDVKDVGRANLVPVDVLCGGFPCQDVSTAGRRAGLVEGSRSGLWFEFSRIIREIRPRYVVVENVAALLTLGLDAVLGELAAIGYDAEWDCVPASSVGAPHRRDRVFVVAYAKSGRQPISGTGDKDSDAHSPRGFDVRPEPLRSGADGGARIVANAESSGRGTRRARGSPAMRARESVPIGSLQDVPDAYRNEHESAPHALGRSRSAELWSDWTTEPDVGRVAHGVPARVDRLRALGNAAVPQVAEVVGRVILELERQRVSAMTRQTRSGYVRVEVPNE